MTHVTTKDTESIYGPSTHTLTTPSFRRIFKLDKISSEESSTKFEVPTLQFQNFIRRAYKDSRWIKEFDYVPEKDGDWCRRAKTQDDDDLIGSEPSFTKFTIPFDGICEARYKQSVVKYNRQFRREMHKLIENQCSAREASYLVRIVSYTSLWPPYHSVSEIDDTSAKFYRLTPKEQSRYKYIMTHEFS